MMAMSFDIAIFFSLGGFMEQGRLKLYRIDMKYVRDLHNADDRVPSVSPQIDKEKRTFLGVVIVCNSRKYVIPLSHPKEKHTRMRTTVDFEKIYNRQGKLIGVLNINLMIPVGNKQLQSLDLKIRSSDSPENIRYKNLCIDEQHWCRENHERIINKANALYKLCTTDSGYKGKSRCLDFQKLEEVCDRYQAK